MRDSMGRAPWWPVIPRRGPLRATLSRFGALLPHQAMAGKLSSAQGHSDDPRPILSASSIALLLTGCATTPPPPPVEVRIPVPVPCIQIIPERPALAWDDLAGAPVYEQVRALLIDRGRLVVHSDELRAVLMGCAAPAPAP